MTEIINFSRRGIQVIESEPLSAIGVSSDNVVGWVVTAPDKDSEVPYNEPFRVSNLSDAAKLDVVGAGRGTGPFAARQTVERVLVAQYFIVVEEGANESETISNIIGGVNSLGVKSGIEALVDCGESPTIIAVPGYSSDLSVINPLALMGRRLSARVVCDGPGTNRADAIALSDSLGGDGTGHDRVYIIDPLPSVFSSVVGGPVFVPPSSVGVSALASVAPWESPDGQGVSVLDVSRRIDYVSTDSATEGNSLLSNGISFFGRTSLGGISLLGNRCVTGRFISHVGLADVIARRLVAASESSRGKNLTRSLITQELQRINNFLSNLEANSAIPTGHRAYLHPYLNNVDNYTSGQWHIVVEYGRYSPNEFLVLHLNASNEVTSEFVESLF